MTKHLDELISREDEKIETKNGIFVPKNHPDYEKVSNNQEEDSEYEFGDIWKTEGNNYVFVIEETKDDITGIWFDGKTLFYKNIIEEKIATFKPTEEAFERVPESVEGELIVTNNNNAYLVSNKMIAYRQSAPNIPLSFNNRGLAGGIEEEDIKIETGIELKFHDLKEYVV